MNVDNDGDSAFPSSPDVPSYVRRGMNLKDWLVGKVLASLINGHERINWRRAGSAEEKQEYVNTVVDYAEAVADEYLRRRAKRTKGD